MKMSGMCIPPSKGSFMMNTSPSSILSPYLASSVSIANGTEPRCSGMVTPCAIISPEPSQSEVE